MPDTSTQPVPLDIPGAVTVTAPGTPTVYAVGASNGVAMTPPPTALMASMHASIAQALTTIPPNHTGGLIALYSKNVDGTMNANAAVVQKVGDNINVLAWLGKSWPGGINYGAAVQVSW